MWAETVDLNDGKMRIVKSVFQCVFCGKLASRRSYGFYGEQTEINKQACGKCRCGMKTWYLREEEVFPNNDELGQGVTK